MGSLSDLFVGTPPTMGIGRTGAMRPPMSGFASMFGQFLQSLIGQGMPQYGGPIDPGMSPTMQNAGVMAQAYGRSPLPSIMGQAQGVLSRFMSPSFSNPYARLMQGGPNYFPGGSGQRIFGGGLSGDSRTPQMGGMGSMGGMGGGMGSMNGGFAPQTPPGWGSSPMQSMPSSPMQGGGGFESLPFTPEMQAQSMGGGGGMSSMNGGGVQTPPGWSGGGSPGVSGDPTGGMTSIYQALLGPR